MPKGENSVYDRTAGKTIEGHTEKGIMSRGMPSYRTYFMGENGDFLEELYCSQDDSYASEDSESSVGIVYIEEVKRNILLLSVRIRVPCPGSLIIQKII